ncbi:MAG: hypothetical protein D6768_02585 [Chloroflexi bacterium]|nr:MAG: hypothetical protein D6768_02585 [Chloroflexota bacterium]
MNIQQRLTFVVGFSLLTVIIVAVVDYVVWPLTGYRWPFLVVGLPAAGLLLARFLPGVAAQNQPAPVFEPQAPAPAEFPPSGPPASVAPAKSPVRIGAAPAHSSEPDAKCPGTDILYQQLVMRSPAGIALLDRAGTLKFVNSAGAKLLGAEPGKQTTSPSLTTTTWPRPGC